MNFIISFTYNDIHLKKTSLVETRHMTCLWSAILSEIARHGLVVLNTLNV